ncbi:MAG: rod shape-determining protein MreC [Dehalococcoidia bacterium]
MVILSRYTWWLGAMAALAFLMTFAGQFGALGPIQGAYLRATEPVENALGAVFRPVAGLLSNAGDINSLRDENRELRLENEALQTELVTLAREAERARELEAALNITTASTEGSRVAANVVHRESSPFTDVLSIDRGSSDGIRVGMVVLSAQGSLLGSVIDVFSDRSFVRLITDSRSRVVAETLDTHVEGTVKGTANRQLELDLAQGEVVVGDMVVTSALSGRFPAGLPIAKVADVSGSPQDLHLTVKLEPLVRLSGARTVLVLTSFVPETSLVGSSP